MAAGPRPDRVDRPLGFVIWISPGDAEALRGEIESTSTSRRVSFESGDELLTILASMVDARRDAMSRSSASASNTLEPED